MDVTFLTWIGYVCSILVFLAPGIAILMQRDVARYTPYPYVLMATNCGVCALYAGQQSRASTQADTLDYRVMAIVNLIGMFLGLFYTLLFLGSARAHPRWTKLLWTLLGGVITFLVGFVCILEGGYTLTCLLRSLYGVAVYSVAWYSVFKVWTSGNFGRLPPLIVAFFALLNCVCWIIITLIRQDYFILVPNGLGAICSALQLWLHLLCRISTGHFADMEPVPAADAHGLDQPLLPDDPEAGVQAIAVIAAPEQNVVLPEQITTVAASGTAQLHRIRSCPSVLAGVEEQVPLITAPHASA